jgi:glycosyltransferase involved in cell wall biosynthesis
MRILLFVPAVSIHMKYWAEAFAARGHVIRVVTLHPEKAGHPFPCPVEVLPGRGTPLKSGYLMTVPRLKRSVRAFEPDVIVSYYATSYGFLAALAGLHPVVLATAGSDVLQHGRPPLRWVRHATSRYAVRRMDLVLGWARHMVDAAVALGADPERTAVQPRGIDLSVFRLRAETPPEPGHGVPVRIVSTRGLRRDYRIDRVIEAAGRLRRSDRPVALTVYGEGPERPRLEEHARAVGLDPERTLPGQARPEEIAAALARTHLYVSVSESDGLSHSLLEAMACGAFPVVSDHPAARDWVKEGETGLLLRQEDDLVDLLEAALADPRRRHLAAAANRSQVEARGDILLNVERLEVKLAQVAGKTSGSARPVA